MPVHAGVVANSTRRANRAFSCQAPQSKIFRFTRITIYGINLAVRCPLRDVSRSSRYVGYGCDGRCGVRCGSVIPEKWETGFPIRITLKQDTPGENAAAYGEVVWSWRRDPGATSAGFVRSATGARKAASPGRARISRKTIARGKPGCPGCTCSFKPVCFLLLLLHAGLRAQSAPGFPCALSQKRDNETANLGQIMPRE